MRIELSGGHCGTREAREARPQTGIFERLWNDPNSIELDRKMKL
jgi:hypothetical protein